MVEEEEFGGGEVVAVRRERRVMGLGFKELWHRVVVDTNAVRKSSSRNG